MGVPALPYSAPPTGMSDFGQGKKLDDEENLLQGQKQADDLSDFNDLPPYSC